MTRCIGKPGHRGRCSSHDGRRVPQASGDAFERSKDRLHGGRLLRSTYHGIPRSTHNIDLVVDVDEPSLQRLIAAFPEEEYYLSADAARDALVRRSQFNIIDLETGWKADLIVRKERPFSRIEFERRETARVLGVEIFVATAEDAILSKLEWSKMGASERQLADARGIVAVKGGALDRAYLAKWAADLGVGDLLRSLG